MALKTDKGLKIYYSIREVAAMFDVNESLLALLGEGVSVLLRPRRLEEIFASIRKEDIENVRLVYHLVKEKGMTLGRSQAAYEAE